LRRYVARIGEIKVNKSFKSEDLERKNQFGNTCLRVNGMVL